MSVRVLGTCGLCGGAVTTPIAVHIVGAPPPGTCESCGAEQENPYGERLPMKRRDSAPMRNTR